MKTALRGLIGWFAPAIALVGADTLVHIRRDPEEPGYTQVDGFVRVVLFVTFLVALLVVTKIGFVSVVQALTFDIPETDEGGPYGGEPRCRGAFLVGLGLLLAGGVAGWAMLDGGGFTALSSGAFLVAGLVVYPLIQVADINLRPREVERLLPFLMTHVDVAIEGRQHWCADCAGRTGGEDGSRGRSRRHGRPGEDPRERMGQAQAVSLRFASPDGRVHGLGGRCRYRRRPQDFYFRTYGTFVGVWWHEIDAVRWGVGHGSSYLDFLPSSATSAVRHPRLAELTRSDPYNTESEGLVDCLVSAEEAARREFESAKRTSGRAEFRETAASR